MDKEFNKAIKKSELDDDEVANMIAKMLS